MSEKREIRALHVYWLLRFESAVLLRRAVTDDSFCVVSYSGQE